MCRVVLSGKVVAGLVSLAAIMLASPLVKAQDGSVTRDELQLLLKQKDEAVAALDALESAKVIAAEDVGALERELISAAMESRRREEQASAAERELISLQTELGEARRELVNGEVALEGLMASLAISGRHRPPAWLSHGDDANRAIRAAILMGRTAPMVQGKTQTLAQQIGRMRALRSETEHELARLEAAEASLALKRAEITRMTAAKRAAFEDVRGDARALRQRVDRLARDAQTIQGLLASLEENAPRAPRMKPQLRLAAASPASGSRTDAPRPGMTRAPTITAPGVIKDFMAPSTGRLIRKWGDSMPGGTQAEGLTFATRPLAQISAPVSGRVEFSGPFRTYGQLLIISTSDGYHILLSGMSETYVGVGQSVRRGEPVARMIDRTLPEPELYMEVRKSGKPVDPIRWMAQD